MDATEKSKRDPDFRFYHCGGKDRVAGIAQSLRAVKVPTVAIVDLDLFSDKSKFFRLFETMGGTSIEIEKE